MLSVSGLVVEVADDEVTAVTRVPAESVFSGEAEEASSPTVYGLGGRGGRGRSKTFCDDEPWLTGRADGDEETAELGLEHSIFAGLAVADTDERGVSPVTLTSSSDLS